MRLNIDEALRYMNIKNGAASDEKCEKKGFDTLQISETLQTSETSEIRRKTEKMAEMLCFMIEPRYIYRILTIKRLDEGIGLEGTDIVLKGELAEKMLAGSKKAAIFICTLGIKFDSMVRTEQVRDMSGAVILDACGSALVEAGCDMAEKEIEGAVSGMYMTDRFSPGYGDLSLELQPKISKALNAEKLLGIHLTDSMLFNPTKTVSAVIGIADKPQPAKIRGCAYCTFRENCELKKGGRSCDK